MVRKLANPKSLAVCTALLALSLGANSASGAGPVVQNPNFNPHPDPVVLDFSDADADLTDPGYAPRPAFGDLDASLGNGTEPVGPEQLANRPGLPAGFAQVGGMIVPKEMLEGAEMVADAEFGLAAPGAPQHGGGPDLNEICAFPDEVPGGIYDYDPRPGGETPRFATVFLNYNGATLMSGGENAAEDLSGIARSGHPFPVYGGGEQKAIAVAQAVQADFDDYAVRVVYLERPPKVLPYTMVMIGGHYSDTTAGPSGGVAPLDCEDFGQRNVCYAFQNAAPASSQANVASQEIGHTLGLGHTSASDSFMAAGYASTQPGDLGLNDSCANTINLSGMSAACTGVNRCHCGDPQQQHDVNTLFATFAPAGVDMEEPTIAIVEPADGSVFEQDEKIVVVFDPADNVGGYGWKLVLEDENGEVLADQVDYDKALQFDLVGLPPGDYTITGVIQDHADHVVSTSITVTVSGDAAESDTDGGSDTDSDTDGEDTGSGPGETDGSQTSGDEDSDSAASGSAETGEEATDGASGSDSDSDSDGSLDESADGCGCTTSAPSPPAASLLLLLGLFARRRRAA